MEDEERQKKLEAGKAKLAQFRQRKAQANLPGRKQKKKKKVASKPEEQVGYVTTKHQEQDDKIRAESGPPGDGEFIINRILRSGDVIKQDQTYMIEPESEVSTTADDYTSEANGCCTVQQETVFKAEDMREEDFSISRTCSEHDAQPFQTRLEIMEEDLTAKQQEIEELNRELEELRGVFGKEGFQQLQDFEAAVKQRDGIITQLTANLQQARKEKDEILQEFLDLTEQSQKLQIQFQQLQASEAMRSTNHGTTTADLIQSKQQLIMYQLQIDEQEQQLKAFQKMNDKCQEQIEYLQNQLQDYAVTDSEKTDNTLKLNSKDQLIEQLEKTVKEHENTALLLKDKMLASDELVQDLNEQIVQKNQETENLRTELTSSKQRERQSSDEIKQLMGTVETLQKRCHMGNLSELEAVQKIEIESHRKMEQLQAELDEMYGKQIVQMKQELQQQHTLEIRRLNEQHKTEMETALGHSVNNLVNEEQIDILNAAINELNAKLRDSHFQRDQIRQELTQQLERSSEKNIQLQKQVQEHLEELNFTKDQIRRASESITDQKYKIQEVEELKDTVEQLKAQLLATSESHKELESEHEAEITNYKIKLDMLEREKDEVLDRMAESQEAELERVRTQLLFSHEEELSKLKEDLEREHKLNIRNLQEDLAMKQSQQLENLQTEFRKEIEEMKCERDNFVIKNNQLLSEIALLKEEPQTSVKNDKLEEMHLRILELETEVEALREVEKEKSALEKGILELQIRNKVLEEQFTEQEAVQMKITGLQNENEGLQQTKKQLEEKLKMHFVSEENKLASVSEDELSEMKEQIKRLTIVNGQLEDREKELLEEVERQRNTFSFAEKNFEVNFQELRDEYDCLLKMKSLTEEKMIKQEVEYEAKLKILSKQLQLLKSDTENCTMKNEVQLDKTPDSSSTQPIEVIEKDATELMEKLEIAQQHKDELSKRLTDLSEVLILRQNEILHLKEELKFLKEQAKEKCEETARIESQEVPDVEEESQEHKQMSQTNLIKAKNESQSEQSSFIVSCDLKEHEQQEENLMEQLILLQNSMKIIVSERDEMQQNQINFSQEKESLLTQIKHLQEKLASESLGSLQTEIDHLRHQLESTRNEQLGLAELVQQKMLLEEAFHKEREEMKHALIITQQEKLELEKKIEAQIGVSVCEQHTELEENQAKETVHKGYENAVAVQGCTASDQDYMTQLEQTKLQAEAELKLQLEAQRISLTQIYAAQLELVQDSLKNEKEIALERLGEKLTASHTSEIRQLQAQSQLELQRFKESHKDFEESSQALIEKLNKKISNECTQLTQLLTSLLSEGNLKEKKEHHDQPEEGLILGNKDNIDEGTQVHKDLTEGARALQTNLQMLQRELHEEYNQLRVLQTQLTNDFKKIEDLQSAYVNLQLQSQEENASLRMQIESSRASSQDLNDLKEQLRVRSARLEEIEKIKLEFCQQKAELENQHVDELNDLRTSHEQQCKEMEKKYIAEIFSLQEKLQNLTSLLSQCRSEVIAHDNQVAEGCIADLDQDKVAAFKDEEKFGVTQRNMKQLDLSQQLQCLGKNVCAMNKEESSDMKEQHNHKLEHVETEIRTQYNQGVGIFGEESIQYAGGDPTFRVLNEVILTDVLQENEEQKSESHQVIHLQKEQYEKRMQEEIAKVIVHMSVQFAQQTEMAKMTRNLQEDPNPCKISEELEKEVEQRLSTLKQDLQIQFDADRKRLENLFSEEKEKLQNSLKQKEAEIQALQRQLENYKTEYKFENVGIVTDVALHEEVLKANQQLYKHSYVQDHSSLNLKELSSECKVEDTELTMHEVAQESLEDLRQELVRQDQEHQQSVEALRQFHALQLERLHDEQEQLLAEVEKLKKQLAENGSIYNEKLTLENERMFAELEKLKSLNATGKERHSQGIHNSTQTEMSKTEDQHKSKEHPHDPKSISTSEEKSEDDDENAITKQRNSLKKTNERLLKVLSEVVKTTAAAEETISRHVSAFVERSIRGQPSLGTPSWDQDTQESIEALQSFRLQNLGTVEEEQLHSYHGHDTAGDDSSIWPGGMAGAPDGGLELSHHFTESIFSSGELDPETEELVLNVGARLQAALEKLLEAISETTHQLEHARITQTELVRKSVRKKTEIDDLRKRQEELLERINEELKAREQLALELHKAEGIIDGYTEEKASLEKQIQEKTEIQNQIAQELQHTSSRLHELEEERQQVHQEKELIIRQQVAMKENAGTVELRLVEAADAAPEADLLEETEKLMKEKQEVQRQAEKEQNDLTKQVKMLESELEEQMNRMIEIEQEKNAEILDLQQQIVALEKQLEKNRKFLDEQAIDREQERDVFQQEIFKLEQQLKTPQRIQPINDQRNREMENLADQLKDKTDRCSELLLAKEQLQRDVQERNEEIEKMENRVRELEHALISTTYPLQTNEERKLHVALEIQGDNTLQIQLQAERDALERKEKEIANLEEQLEQFREELLNKNEEVQQLLMQLEIQKKEAATQLQEIQHENKRLEDEVDSLHSSGNHCSSVGNLSQTLKERDQELEKLSEQIIKLEQQLELPSDNKMTQKKNEHMKELEAQIEFLKCDQQRLKKYHEEEVEQLNEVIEKLQLELTNVTPLELVPSEDAENLKLQLDKADQEQVSRLINPVQQGATSIIALTLELEQVKAEAEETKEQLNNYRNQTEKLKEDLQAKALTIINLQENFNIAKEALGKEKGISLEHEEQTPQKCIIKERPVKSLVDSAVQSKILISDITGATSTTNVEDQTNCKSYISSSEEITKAYLGQPEPSITLQLRDNNVSDSSSGSPRTFDIPPDGQEYRNMSAENRVNHVSHTVHTTRREDTENLPDKIKSLLHEVHQEGIQVLTLSKSPYFEGQQPPLESHTDSWFQERWELLNMVQSLKDVLANVQGTGETKALSPENITDWRRELLQAVQNVFNKERDILMVALRAQASSLNSMDAMALLSLLKEQEAQRSADMEHLMTADRDSMMMEIRELWSYLQRSQQGDKMPMTVEEQIAQRSEVELLGSSLQQKETQFLKLQTELNTVKEKGAELQDQLNLEKIIVAEMKNELSQTKLELETTLKTQHKHLKDLEMLRVELTDKAAEVDMLSDVLAREQKKARELQWALEKEQCKTNRKEEQDREELEDLKFALEDQKKKYLHLECTLENERVTINDLRQNLDSEKALHETELSHEKSRVSELQVALDAEKSRSCELSSALERERRILKLLPQAKEKQEGMVKTAEMTSEMLIGELQRQLEDQHNRIVELVSEMESYKLESVQLRQHLEEQQQINRKSLLKEQESHKHILEKVDSLQLQAKELMDQLEKEKHEVLKLQREKEKLKETVQALQEMKQVRTGEAENQLDTDVAVTDKIPQAKLQNTCNIGLSTDRTRNWIMHQKLAATENGKDASVYSEQWYTESVNGTEIDGGGSASGENINMERIRQKMQLIISKLRMLANKVITSRMQHSSETTDDEDLTWLQNNIQDIALQLQIPVPENLIPSSGSTAALTERLLKQNTDLTSFVSRLTEEKNDLHNSLLKLQEEVRKYRQRNSSDQLSRRPVDNQDCVDALIKSERIVWAREKSNLQKALKLAEAELSKMKAEARSESLHTQLLGSISETVAVKRIYGKYLRAEGFRKALIYQKKYLLLLLGGFQECEQATLSFIARMGGHPSCTDLQTITRRSRGFTRFRSVVRVSIAISRLRFLVRRWLRVAGSSSLTGNRNGDSQVSATEPRADSPFLHSGSISLESSLTRELFGEHRHSTSRQRSGQESPRSITNSQPRYQSSLPDSNPSSLASSHLQSYDPDRALTDYINRLEALQRRLGSVQSGSTTYAQMYYGTRR
ncbi:A-kinase anchor protein 9 isoform X8 [Chiloscyllium plagiosum]|uniref:A-kinase anchor protein 9 isoform X8 n=1 Tax=Chiloscyllium plagiosum TaxID=36176 RepID=UPI001CB7DF19|nr:A-kinase anchor protein 9 isoform X8 [Chiloscyllium plagiosum]